MLKVIHKLTVHMDGKHLTPCIDAVQGDASTRVMELTTLADGQPWEVPQGMSVSLAYRKSDGTAGWYDTLPDGSEACHVQGNTVQVTLAPQVLSAPGEVQMAVILRDPDTLEQLAAFPLTAVVVENPAAGQAISNDYYQYSTMEQLNELLDQFRWELDGKGRFQVYVTKSDDGTYTSDYGDTAISEAIKAGKDCYCLYNAYFLPLTYRFGGRSWFTAIVNNQEVQVIVSDYEVRVAVADLAAGDGKSAYEYAQEGGYTGTEEEFAAKLAKEYVAIDEEGNARLPLSFNICDEEGEPMVDVNCYSDGNDQLILFLEASVGGPVQLKGVAAGVEDDQAVNVKQLREAVGESAVFATVEQTDTGATVTISDKNGTTTADLVNGEDGKTPVKGVDYYTEADKAEMVELVLAALPDGSEVAY